jgi:tetratricopeptide (TPR) repeat protein
MICADGTLRTTLLQLAVAALFLAVPVAAAQDPLPARKLIDEGVRLHDQGKLEEALVKYRQALELAPDDSLARFELAMTLFHLARYQECVEAAEAALASPGRYEPDLYAVLGNCRDQKGDSKAAVKAFKKGLEKSPGNPLLLFNLAVTRYRQGEFDESEELLGVLLKKAPRHSSAHRLLSAVYLVRGEKVASVLAMLRFLSLEPVSPRAAEAARMVVEVYGQGVEQKSETEVTITLSDPSMHKGSDFADLEMVLPMLSALGTTEEWRDQLEIKKLAHTTTTVFEMLAEKPERANGTSLAAELYLRYFVGVTEAKLGEAFTYRALRSLALPGTENWIVAHAADMERLEAWLVEH